MRKRLFLKILTSYLFLFNFFFIILGPLQIQAAVKKKTEFDYKPRKIVPFAFGSLQFRGRDYMTTSEIGKTIGVGIGALYNINIDPSWRGHKFLYSYLDVEFQQEYNSARLDETMKPILVINPGIMVRSYIPFIKIFYGSGLSFRIGDSDFEKWGVFGQAGIEFYWGFYLSARMVVSPGEGIVNNEIRFGYMHLPSKNSRGR